ncbi:phasin family protein [Lasius niger]|uniref:Phasin family protein n=1 Tax=Lasius niger TaxID=67767 RepID=A0A0J7L5L1_LASNI|nr:phasin family protein [Lasius niger]
MKFEIKPIAANPMFDAKGNSFFSLTNDMHDLHVTVSNDTHEVIGIINQKTGRALTAKLWRDEVEVAIGAYFAKQIMDAREAAAGWKVEAVQSENKQFAKYRLQRGALDLVAFIKDGDLVDVRYNITGKQYFCGDAISPWKDIDTAIQKFVDQRHETDLNEMLSSQEFADDEDFAFPGNIPHLPAGAVITIDGLPLNTSIIADEMNMPKSGRWSARDTMSKALEDELQMFKEHARGGTWVHDERIFARTGDADVDQLSIYVRAAFDIVLQEVIDMAQGYRKPKKFVGAMRRRIDLGCASIVKGMKDPGEIEAFSRLVNRTDVAKSYGGFIESVKRMAVLIG